MNKAQSLWFLLNKIDREDQLVLGQLEMDKEKYPFFYLLKWNEAYYGSEKKKIALQSLNRVNYYYSVMDAPNYQQKDYGVQIDHDSDRPTQNELIDRFLINLPSISKPKKDFTDYQRDDNLISEGNETLKSLPVSETFAKILIKQEKFDLAIRIYEQLSLIKPEKSIYFANQIFDLKNKII
jgi:hypothetical protein